MKKLILLALAFIFTSESYAQRCGLKGINLGLGIPVEFYNLEAAGADLQIGFDRTYPISDRFAFGFYLSAGGGILAAFHPFNEDDRIYSNFKFCAGLLGEFGDLSDRPFLVGVSPCLGLGLLDLDLVLPIEVRFGRMLNDKWYLMGEFVYGFSHARETVSIEPAIRLGYKFPCKRK